MHGRKDHDSWITHNGFGVNLFNGSVYVLFEGQSQVLRFDLHFCSFETYENYLAI